MLCKKRRKKKKKFSNTRAFFHFFFKFKKENTFCPVKEKIKLLSAVLTLITLMTPTLTV